jgi:FkbM family methyltransferase
MFVYFVRRLHTLRQSIRLVVAAFLSRLMVFIVGSHVSSMICETEQGRFAVSPSDVFVGRHLARSGRYETATLEMLLSLLPQMNEGALPHVLVVGAHIGSIAIPLAHAGCLVSAIEANPHTAEILRLNILLNGLVDEVKVFEVAASDRFGTVDFLMASANSGGSKIAPPRRRFRFVFDRPVATAVVCSPLDALLPDADADLVVLDVEGSEVVAIRGMRKIMARAKYLFVEVDPDHIVNVASFSVSEFVSCVSAGFKAYRTVDGPWEDVGLLLHYVEALARSGSRSDILLVK